MSLENGIHEPIVEQCKGCLRATPDGVCVAWIEPKYKWRHGHCNGATHVERELTPEQKKRVGQQHHVKKMKVSRKQQEAYSRIGD